MTRQILSAFGTRVITLLLTFCASAVTARALTPESRGDLAIMIAIPSFGSAFGLVGLDVANLYFAGQSSRTFSFVTRWALLHGLGGGGILAVAIVLTGLLWQDVRFGLSLAEFLLAAFMTPVALTVSLLGVAEAGRGRIAVYNIVAASAMVLYLAGSLGVFAVGRSGVDLFYGAFALGQIASLLVLLFTTKPWRIGDGEMPTISRYLSYGSRAFALGIFQFLMLRLDTLAIQVLAGSTAVGLYAVAYPLAEALILISVAVNVILVPRVAQAGVSAKTSFRIALLTLLSASICAMIVGAVAPVLIPRVYGSDYDDAVRILWYLLPGVAILTFGSVLQSHLSGVNRFRPGIASSMTALFVMVILEILLIPSKGALGAAIASSTAYALFTSFISIAFIVDNFRETGRTFSLRRIWSVLTDSAIVKMATIIAAAIGIALLAGAMTPGMPFIIVAATGTLVLLLILVRPTVGLMLLALAAPLAVPLSSYVSTSYFLVSALLSPTLAGLILQRGIRLKNGGLPYILVAVYFVISWFFGEVIHGTVGNLGKGFILVSSIVAPLLIVPFYPMNRLLARRNLTLLTYSIVAVAVWYLMSARELLAGAGNTEGWIAVAGASDIANHNVAGALIVLAIAVLLPRLTEDPSIARKLVIAAALTTLFMAALYSFSRSTYIAIPAMLAIFAIRRGLRNIAVAVAVLVIGIQLLPSTVVDRIKLTGSGSTDDLDPSSAVRIDLWHAAIDIFRDHPLFGVGLYRFGDALPTYWLDTSVSRVTDVNLAAFSFAHNTPLTIASQLGLVGLILVANIGYSMWFDAWKAVRVPQFAAEGETAVLAIVGMAIVSLFGEPLFTTVILVPFVLIIAAARQPLEGAH